MGQASSGPEYESIHAWQRMGRAQEVDEPRLPWCGSIVDQEIQNEANKEAEKFEKTGDKFVFNWRAMECRLDIKIAAVASIGMQVLETILLVIFPRKPAQMGCYLVIAVAALVTVVSDIRCVRRTAISFVQEAQTFDVPLLLPASLKRNFCLYLSLGVVNTMLHVWWVGSFTLTTVIAIKHRPSFLATAVWCLINFRYVWGFLSFWIVKQEEDGVVKSSDFRPEGEIKFRYLNVFREETGRAEFLHGLAATVGMQTVMLQITPYRRACINRNKEKVNNAVDYDQTKAKKEWGYCLGDFRRLLMHQVTQFLVTHIPKAFIVKYQCFRLALALADEAQNSYYTQFASILSALVCFGPIFITIFQVEELYFTLKPLCEKKDFQGEPRGYTDKGKVDERRIGKDIRNPLWAFRVEYAIACVFHLLAGVHVVMLLSGSRAVLLWEVFFVSKVLLVPGPVLVLVLVLLLAVLVLVLVAPVPQAPVDGQADST